MSNANQTQVGGDHYKSLGQFQPWDVLKHWLTPEEYRGYQKGVAIAYLAREQSKGGDQDIQKAAHHLQKLIEVIAEQAAVTKAAEVPYIGEDRRVEREDGWSEADGSKILILDTGVMLDVRLRNGEVVRNVRATSVDFSHHDAGDVRHSHDVVAYRWVATLASKL